MPHMGQVEQESRQLDAASKRRQYPLWAVSFVDANTGTPSIGNKLITRSGQLDSIGVRPLAAQLVQ